MTLLALLSKVMEYRYLKKAKAQAKRYHAKIARVMKQPGKRQRPNIICMSSWSELGRKCEARAMYPVRQANVGNVQDMLAEKQISGLMVRIFHMHFQKKTECRISR